jgi:hypothetical protein
MPDDLLNKIRPAAGRPDLLLPPHRILDLCDAQGAFCGKLLADLGADVVKVEPPGGDPARYKEPFARDERALETSLDFLAYNTNKRSLTLDIEHPRGRACLLDLVLWARDRVRVSRLHLARDGLLRLAMGEHITEAEGVLDALVRSLTEVQRKRDRLGDSL